MDNFVMRNAEGPNSCILLRVKGKTKAMKGKEE
jgi:hypothetical protein